MDKNKDIYSLFLMFKSQVTKSGQNFSFVWDYFLQDFSGIFSAIKKRKWPTGFHNFLDFGFKLKLIRKNKKSNTFLFQTAC